ncbi:uncharacterized protein ACN2A1_003416 [Glossina fuscipes fuscipes]|uniref:Uncharacterized protein n=1 Tax=Glossina palpalis gambiensis TaxID=67801 RepID=A0A1B0AQN6_9MUSC
MNMAAPRQGIRTVLADRLEPLRVATTPTNANRPNEPATIFAATPVDNITNVALAQDYASLTHSPDELIIRQRGRRKPLLKWTPEKAAAVAANNVRSPFQRTPTKVPMSTSMILRSSPRKRLAMGTLPPEPKAYDGISPIKPDASQELWPSSPNFKKPNLQELERPIAQTSDEIPLHTLLQGLTRQQLVELIVNELVAGDAKVEKDLRAQLPMPDIQYMEQELLHAKRMIFKSLPTSRLCKKTDSTAYTRASLHLNEFRRLLSQHIKQLQDSSHWDALIDYTCMAWPYVRATPNWDNFIHNAIRKQCFRTLTCSCIAAIKYGGSRLGINRLHRLERSLNSWLNDSEDIQSCVNVLKRMLGKGRYSL